MSQRFGLIGAAGYIAPRHLEALKTLGHQLVVAMDVSDSVGIIDRYFPEADFFTEFEQFAAFIEDLNRQEHRLDYLIVCSPNYLHLPHIKFGLRNGINVICEKPLVLDVLDLERLKDYEQFYSAKVYSILQLRLHPAIIELRADVLSSTTTDLFDVDLTYLTSRGDWYLKSWKGVDEKSGGLAANIGVHFFDMLSFVFGGIRRNEIHHRDSKTCCGYAEYQRARVRWFLSIDAKFLPQEIIGCGKSTFRSLCVEGKEVEFSDGFTDLHTQSYREILAHTGYGIDDNYAAIKTISDIRTSTIVENPAMFHPLLRKV